MTSSKFSRKPRTQPTPKICRVIPPGPEPQPPPPPPWPPLRMYCIVDWTIPNPPGPDWEFHEEGTINWVAGNLFYYGNLHSSTDDLQCWFCLVPSTGGCSVCVWPHPGPFPVGAIRSPIFYIPTRPPINEVVTTWRDPPSGHTLTTRHLT